MKRTGFSSKPKPLERKPFTSKPKRIKQRSAKKAAYMASDDGKAGMAYMGQVKALPCCVCGAAPPSEAHHCRSDGMARDDLKTIPLCIPCHRGPNGYHLSKRTWHANNGKDHEYIAETKRQIGVTHG